jgi:hypothetical protein
MIKMYFDKVHKKSFTCLTDTQLMRYMIRNKIWITDIELLWDNGEVSNEAILN